MAPGTVPEAGAWSAPVGVTVDGQRLDYELAIRGLSAQTLAKSTGLSPATVSVARRSGRVQVESLALIVRVLDATPINPTLERLLRSPRARSDTAATGEPPKDPEP